MRMTRTEIHPKARLSTKRNVKAGLRARSKILFTLEEARRGTPDIAKRSGLGYGCIMYHLRTMRIERLVERSKRRPYVWELTGFGQQRLDS